MSSVKGISRRPTKYDESMRLDDYEPKHLGYLIDRLGTRQNLDIWSLAEPHIIAGRHHGLSGRHFRLLSMIPRDGARVTDLARVARITKQALGQFVTFLEELGYVETRLDPNDRRVRIVSRSALGDQAVRETNEMYTRLERKWKRQVGADRWRVFREVMTELTTGWDPDERSGDE